MPPACNYIMNCFVELLSVDGVNYMINICLQHVGRMPLIDKYRDMGTVVMGKIESGSVRRGDTLMIMPNKV